jgi:anti-sigma regulatory factor (Ser/Thr protein kinase)
LLQWLYPQGTDAHTPSEDMVMTQLTLSLPPVPSASRVARAAVRERFAGVLGRFAVADLELVISELVTNAIDHGRGTIDVAIQHDGYELHGSVTDEGDGFVYVARTVADDELRGRGLSVVDALATSWGIREGNTHVWFHMGPGGG